MQALPPWHPHYDVWFIVGLLAAGYFYAELRRRPVTAKPATPRQRVWFSLGVLAILAVSEWPVHELAEESLFSVHMVQHLVLTLVAPAAMLLGLPRWMAEALLPPPVLRMLRPLAKPVPAFILFNGTLVVTHWPDFVAWSLRSELFHFSAHTWLFATAALMWLPVLSPTPLIPRLSPPMQMFYLFTQTLLPNIPASFLTFSRVPLYPAYGDAALAFGITPVEDQTFAGLIMKLSGTFFFLVVLAVIWFRWTAREERWERLQRDLSRT